MSSIVLKTINHHKVGAIPLPFELSRPVRGAEVCTEAFANIFLCAKKKSGKTSSLFHLLKECTSKKTNIIVFCTTLFKDNNWIAIRKWIEKRGNPHEFFTSVYENGEDQIKSLITRLNEEAQDNEAAGDAKPQFVDNTDKILHYLANHGCGEEEEQKPKKKKKDKYQTPEHLIIFDDIASELKSPSLLTLLTWNRHYKTKVIISSQWLNHLLPQSRAQLDLILVFKNMPEQKLEEIWKGSDLHTPLPLFLAMYRKATQVSEKCKFPFFYIDTRDESFRRNFNQKFIFPDQEE